MKIRLGNIVKRFRTDGLVSALRLLCARGWSSVRSLAEDRRRGVLTARELTADDLGITDLRNHWYVATDYETFHSAMRRVKIRPGEDVFVDIGAGMGRIVLLAAEWPFRRVIGVEFSQQLTEIGNANLRAARPGLRCQAVELVLADATEWSIPPDATVLFLFNPFEGAVLAKVCANIRASLLKFPRQLTLIYVRPDKFFEKEIAWQEWLTRQHDIACVEGRVSIYQSKPVPSLVSPPATGARESSQPLVTH